MIINFKHLIIFGIVLCLISSTSFVEAQNQEEDDKAEEKKKLEAQKKLEEKKKAEELEKAKELKPFSHVSGATDPWLVRHFWHPILASKHPAAGSDSRRPRRHPGT